ncbi:hypothetical protein [Sphingomonas sp. OTU376]|uniref:hypothetical protein n=1 Tax=Sphingomonas sp. OTU376 TaxID=3043863 RepID=UPI00313E82F3
MATNIKALLAAPAPIFALVSIAIARPSLGWSDVAVSLGIAFAASYGMLVAGLPVHLMLRRFHRTDFGSYLLAFLLALAVAVAVTTFTEVSPAPLASDNSPFAEMTLRNGGWIVLLLFGAPIASLIAWIFWKFVASPREELC